MKLAHALPRTCGGALRYAPALPTGAAVLWSYDSRADGDLEYSPRWGCVANTAYNKTKGTARLGPVCLAAAQTFPGAAAPFVDRNGISLLASGHRVQRWGKVERQHFSGAAFLRFPTIQRETCTYRNPVLHRRADHGTDEDQLP